MLRRNIAHLAIAVLLLGIVVVPTQDVRANTTCPHSGDVNEDSTITPQDALMAFQHYLGIITLDDCRQDRANVTGDGSVTPADALCIFQKYLGLPSCLDLKNAIVPNVIAMNRADAKLLITLSGLAVGSISEELRISVPTGQVVRQNLEPGSRVVRGSSVDLVVVKPPPADAEELIPNDWAGEWEITLTYRDAETDSIKETTTSTDIICTRDAVGLALMEAAFSNSQTECTGGVTENRIDASCSAPQIILDECTLEATVQLEMNRNGDIITGTGQWTATGDCGLLLTVNEGEKIEITGVRKNTDQGLCKPPVSSFLQKFMRHSFLRLSENVYHDFQ